METGIYRSCLRCGQRYEISTDELRDQSYDPLCLDCLRRRSEANEPVDPRDRDYPIGDLN
jgi:hypothetical protein